MLPFDRPIHWGTFLSVLLWNTSGYDSVGALAAEVHSPGRDFPRAMVATILLVSLVYILPLCVAISLDHSNLSKWTDGHFTIVAQQHVGDWLSAWISIGGALSAVGLLNTLLCTAARVAVSSARLYVLPPCLAKLDGRGQPRRATLAIAVVLAFACALPFAELVSISMLFYGCTTAFEFFALLILRHSEPSTPRPFQVPVSRRWLPLALAPPLLLCLLLIFLAPPEAWVMLLLSVAVGIFTFVISHGFSLRAAGQCCHSVAAIGGATIGEDGLPIATEGLATPTAATPGPRFAFPRLSKSSSGGYGKLRTCERPAELEGAGGEGEHDEVECGAVEESAAESAAEEEVASVATPHSTGSRRARRGSSEGGGGGNGNGGHGSGRHSGGVGVGNTNAERRADGRRAPSIVAPTEPASPSAPCSPPAGSSASSSGPSPVEGHPSEARLLSSKRVDAPARRGLHGL